MKGLNDFANDKLANNWRVGQSELAHISSRFAYQMTHLQVPSVLTACSVCAAVESNQKYKYCTVQYM